MAGANVTQYMHARLDRKRRQARTDKAGIYQAVIRRIGCIKVFKLSVGEIVIAAVNDDAANGGAMSADELGGGVGDDVCTILKRTEKLRRVKSIVDE